MNSHCLDRMFRFFGLPVSLAVVIGALPGCSNADDNGTAATNNPAAQAQATQLAVASAQAAHDHNAMAMMPEDSSATATPPMAAAVTGADIPSTNMGTPSAVMPTGMARLLGQPPSAMGSTATGGLPSAIGAPHIYHLGADTFFLDQANAIELTSDQQTKLAALKENAAVAYATTQRKIDQGEQDLWVLSSSETPDIAKIETKVGETARLTAQQRMDFIRTMGKAVGVLSDGQRKAVAAQGGAGPSPPPMPSGASPMSVTSTAAPSGGMGMAPPGKMPMGMGKAPRGAMADAGSGGMGHM